ncbi:MAG: hypothetical protein ABSG63_12040 [Spirochaetia bacterium]|jgi:hypothetical protein
MRAAATIILCVGLSFGVLGGVASIALFFFGGTVVSIVTNVAPAQVPTDTHFLSTPLHAISVFARLPVVLLGGILGLLGNAPGASRARARSCGALAFAAGLVLLLYQGWICAGAYVIAGVLVFFPLVPPPTSTTPRE